MSGVFNLLRNKRWKVQINLSGVLPRFLLPGVLQLRFLRSFIPFQKAFRPDRSLETLEGGFFFGSGLFLSLAPEEVFSCPEDLLAEKKHWSSMAFPLSFLSFPQLEVVIGKSSFLVLKVNRLTGNIGFQWRCVCILGGSFNHKRENVIILMSSSISRIHN